MNFTRFSLLKNTEGKGHSTDQAVLFLGALVLLLVLSSCSVKISEEKPQGDLQVQIPISVSENDTPEYKLQTVTLKNISSLNEVRGQYAQFFYAPGLTQNELSGMSPVAFFIKTIKNVFIPKDEATLHMSTLYYHMQNLTQFAQSIGAMPLNSKPFQIGLKTNIKNDVSLRTNNAFYDGRSDAMLFVPYTASELPIAVNAGIIAHEFFHSLFFKIVYSQKSVDALPPLSQKFSKDTVHTLEGYRPGIINDTFRSTEVSGSILSRHELFNETYLRGINEGLADFWGWSYSEDTDFLKWSLSTHSSSRTLTKQSKINYVSSQKIKSTVDQAAVLAANPSEYLSQAIYAIGTPYARFMKELVEVKSATEQKNIKQVKTEVSKSLFLFLQQLGSATQSLKADEVLSVDDLFLFFGNPVIEKVSSEQCELVIQYLNSEDSEKPRYKCEKKESLQSFEVIKI